MRRNMITIGAAALLLGSAIGGFSVIAIARTSAANKSSNPSMNARVRRLEDTEQIRNLLNRYGSTLDQRDFVAFGELFAEHSEYAGGGPMGTQKGPKAIALALENQMTSNPAHLNSPNFHIFFNESIDVDGDTAIATSKSAYVVRSDSNKPDIVFLAHYDDTLVRENGQWKFERRIVHGDIPAPR
jgi:SnoaL-like domain